MGRHGGKKAQNPEIIWKWQARLNQPRDGGGYQAMGMGRCVGRTKAHKVQWVRQAKVRFKEG